MKEGRNPSERAIGLHKERARHPTLPLDNTVIWTNDRLQAPFKFELGKPSPLGLTFDVTETAPEKSAGLPLRTRKAHHGRSADLGAVYFQDSEGRMYRDIDLKGAGSVDSRGVPQQWYRDVMGNLLTFILNPNAPMEERMNGLMDKEDALHDAEIAETFAAFGVRTHRTLAVIELNELREPSESGEEMRVVSIEELRKQAVMPADFIPVVQVRAFGTKTRVDDVRRDALGAKEIKDAIALVSQENDTVKDIPTYLAWFARTLGENLSRMHKHGYVHRGISSHNVTADCRLTDFDTVEALAAGEVLYPPLPVFASMDEELAAPPPESDFWDGASQDLHRAIRTVLILVDGVRKRFPEEPTEVYPETLPQLLEVAYLRENPKANPYLRDLDEDEA